MPSINIYIPNDLAKALADRRAEIKVSAVCAESLWAAVHAEECSQCGGTGRTVKRRGHDEIVSTHKQPSNAPSPPVASEKPPATPQRLLRGKCPHPKERVLKGFCNACGERVG